MVTGDTIVAISSAVGPSARMIVRLSGPMAHVLLSALTGQGEVPAGPGPSGESDGVRPASTASRLVLRVSGLHVPAWVYRFHAPRSYTGEDLAELHLPGNPLLVRLVVDELLRRGARAAEAGEFTARAYFNGRMDLTAAEGVAALVGAHGQADLDAARRLLSGELARRLRPMIEELASLLSLVEAGIDFSEEDVSFISSDAVAAGARRVEAALARLAEESARFERLSHEPRIALVGRPNAGKSTLLNALAGRQRAVVSEVAGTTRDVLSVEVALERGMAWLIDAAGIEEEPATDPIAAAMHRQAIRAVETADRVVLLIEAGDDRPPIELPRAADQVVRSKGDLAASPPPAGLVVSAKTGQGMPQLRRMLDELAFGSQDAGAGLALNVRHLRCIDDARRALCRAGELAAVAGPEVVALELRVALDSLGQVVGEVTPDDILGRIFKTFCIGK